ncbi:hypothetical protein V8F33_010108 [Rhypophila sp. PSN 637]
MSLTTTTIPEGIISGGPEWCLKGLLAFDSPWPNDAGPYIYNECANSTRNTSPSDFQTICCDGDIIDPDTSLYRVVPFPLNVTNLICCRKGGQLLPGGISAPQTNDKRCYPSEIPTPLASLAATNTKNAQIYIMSYESALAGTADWTRRHEPTCLWVQTTHPDVTGRIVEVEVPVASITTLPPITTGVGGWVVTSTLERSTADLGVTGTGEPAAEKTTTSGARMMNGGTVSLRAVLGLGLVMAGQLV